MSWDDVRVLLAVARHKSLRRAAVTLGVSYPTARRRLEALESHLGVSLFVRHPRGLSPTPAGEALVVKAEQVEAAIDALRRTATNEDPELRGAIRVTLPEELATDLLMPDLVAFSQAWPDIDLDVETAGAVRDLGRREADVAIRVVRRGGEPTGDVVGRKVGELYAAVYGSGDRWIGWGDVPGGSPPRTGPFEHLPVAGAFPHPKLQRAACLAGLGVTRLPCFYADGVLERRTEPVCVGDVWVLVHRDLRRNTRMRRFRDFMADAIRRHAATLAGRALSSTPSQGSLA